MKCRHCCDDLELELIDLGYAPPSNSYVKTVDIKAPEVTFPLRVMVCTRCWLVQTEDFTDASQLFDSDYAYFSSTSTSWLEHARRYVEKVTNDLGLGENSFVVELASNDGYLLKNFVQKRVPCLGIEPTESTALESEKLGVNVLREFFGEKVAIGVGESYGRADLIIGNNVYAHVPDINDFTKGIKSLLADTGIVTLEFPHLYQLIQKLQFDTIYHEHFSYLSVETVSNIFSSAGLTVFDVEALPTHGGSVRVYGCHSEADFECTGRLKELLKMEKDFGLNRKETYKNFSSKVIKIRDDIRTFFIQCHSQNKKVAAYGAAAKGNTLLNFCGIDRSDLIAVFDGAAAKQGKLMPGSHIPILAPDELNNIDPDVLVILPWNLQQELVETLRGDLGYKGEIVTLLPQKMHI